MDNKDIKNASNHLLDEISGMLIASQVNDSHEIIKNIINRMNKLREIIYNLSE